MRYEDLFEIDKWAMQKLHKLIADVGEGYETSVFHRVFSLLYSFCTVEMSSIYMDVLKDRMYCDAADSPSRRSAQTAMYSILDSLVRMLAPILVHTAEEAWAAMKVKTADVDSVHLALMPKADASIDYKSDEGRWEKLMALRDEALRVLEGLRREKKIASNQQACVTFNCDEEDAAVLNGFGLEQFAALCIVSEVRLQKTSGERTVAAQKSAYGKCQRCWNYWPSVGTSGEHPDLCNRCIEVTSA
ncbi:MAG: class I tRNA ligase family protein [Planctomycetota bacterium]